jgi:teichuronic acid biosynthesis glycosyltransferase TuaC
MMEKLEILTVANIVPRKRIDLCARICAEMAKKYDITWRVIGIGAERDKIKQAAPSNMIFMDTVDSLNPYYRNADIFILPSYGEGFGMVYIEAIMCGTPVICRKGDAGDEIIEFTGGGMAVEIPDSDDEAIIKIIEAAEEILRNCKKYASEDTRAKARKMVSPTDIKNKWLKLLEKHEPEKVCA